MDTNFDQKEKRFWLFTKHIREEDEDRRFLTAALSPEERELDCLTGKQVEALHRMYVSENLYHENVNEGGDFGVYFNLRYCTLQSLLKGSKPKVGGISYSVFDAKTMINRVCREILEAGVNTKNMIYFNKECEYGKIFDKTIKMETLKRRNKDETIKKVVDSFLGEIYKNMNYKGFYAKLNELVIKWPVKTGPETWFCFRSEHRNLRCCVL